MKFTMVSILALCWLCSTNSQAADIFNTVDSTVPNAIGVYISGGTNNKFVASSFVVDSGYQAIVASITLGIAKGDNDTTFALAVYKSAIASNAPTSFVSGGSFGSQLATSVTMVNTVFTASQPVTLEGGYRYWLMLGVTSNSTNAAYKSAIGGGPPWNQVVDLAPTPGITWVGSNTADIYSWYSAATDTLTTPVSTVSLTGGSGLGNTSIRFALDGTVTAVPEPGAYGLSIASVLVIGVLRRRQNLKA